MKRNEERGGVCGLYLKNLFILLFGKSKVFQRDEPVLRQHSCEYAVSVVSGCNLHQPAFLNLD